jgi:hypothetical protein
MNLPSLPPSLPSSQVKSLEGFGMDSYLHLCKLGDRCEDLGLQVRKEGGREGNYTIILRVWGIESETREGGREGKKGGIYVMFILPSFSCYTTI